MKKKKSEGIRYLSPGYLSRAVRRFGYQFSVRKYLGYLFGLYGCIAFLVFAYRLKLIYIVAIAVLATCFVPGVFVMTYRNLYEAKRFEDVTSYMEQILYSFKRRAKILNALEDVLVLFEADQSKMYDAVLDAVNHIQNAHAKGNIYREAFAHIEKEYGCSRLYKIHDFMIEAEAVGGDFNTAVGILLNDRKLWMDRVYELQREKQNVKTKISIGTGLSFLIGGMTVFMLPKEFKVTGYWISQIVTTAMILLNLLIWYTAWKKLSKSLIHKEEDEELGDVKRQYEYVMHGDLKKAKIKTRMLLLMLLPVLLLAVWKKSLAGMIGVGLFIVLLQTQPTRKYKVSLKYVRREVEKTFPQWLMNMSLHLQTDNVHVSLAKSVSQAPQILREELSNLVSSVEEEPDSVRPYLMFMEKMQLPDITSAMKVLYSMAEFGTSDINGQIGTLIERSGMLTDKAERIKNEDYIAGIGFLVLLPMLTGVMKMLTDLALVLVYILSAVNQVG